MDIYSLLYASTDVMFAYNRAKKQMNTILKKYLR